MSGFHKYFSEEKDKSVTRGNYLSDTDSDTENDENFLPEPIISLFDPITLLEEFSRKQFKSFEETYPWKPCDYLHQATQRQALPKIGSNTELDELLC